MPRVIEYEDGSVNFIEDNPVKNLFMQFGPCTCTLFSLVNDGFVLEVGFSRFHKWNKGIGKGKLRLKKGKESYVLRTVRYTQVVSCDNLCDLIKEDEKIQFYHGAREYDPWEKLKEKYPKPPESEKMIGNMTAGEYILFSVKRLRKSNKCVDTREK